MRWINDLVDPITKKPVESDADGRHFIGRRLFSARLPHPGLRFDALRDQRGDVLNVAARYLAVQTLEQIPLHHPGIAVAVFGGYQLGEPGRGVADNAGAGFQRDEGGAAGRTLVGVALHPDGAEGRFVFFLHPLLLRGQLGVADHHRRSVAVEIREASLGGQATRLIELILDLLFGLEEA